MALCKRSQVTLYTEKTRPQIYDGYSALNVFERGNPGYRFTKNRTCTFTCKIYDRCKSTFAYVSKSLSLNFDSGRART